MKLSEVNTSRGAPMGRSALHVTGLTAPHFELERCPLNEGYDAGGAYWGTPDNLWCVDLTTPLTSTTIVHYFVRAADRAAAMKAVLVDYPGATFEPENGSLIGQMIDHLQAYCDRCHERDPQEDLRETEEVIELLQGELDVVLSLLADCESGLHSWIYETGKLPANTRCNRCGALYGNPD